MKFAASCVVTLASWPLLSLKSTGKVSAVSGFDPPKLGRLAVKNPITELPLTGPTLPWGPAAELATVTSAPPQFGPPLRANQISRSPVRRAAGGSNMIGGLMFPGLEFQVGGPPPAAVPPACLFAGAAVPPPNPSTVGVGCGT